MLAVRRVPFSRFTNCRRHILLANHLLLQLACRREWIRNLVSRTRQARKRAKDITWLLRHEAVRFGGILNRIRGAIVSLSDFKQQLVYLTLFLHRQLLESFRFLGRHLTRSNEHNPLIGYVQLTLIDFVSLI